jgi:hypothetical protein
VAVEVGNVSVLLPHADVNVPNVLLQQEEEDANAGANTNELPLQNDAHVNMLHEGASVNVLPLQGVVNVPHLPNEPSL